MHSAPASGGGVTCGCGKQDVYKLQTNITEHLSVRMHVLVVCMYV